MAPRSYPSAEPSEATLLPRVRSLPFSAVSSLRLKCRRLPGGFRLLVVLPAAVIALVAAPVALAHSGAPIGPSEDASALQAAIDFSRYGIEHILLGYDHLLFLGGLALISTQLRDVVAVVGLFAISYSATLIGGTLLGIVVPGLLIDGVIALSVGFVGLQIAFGSAEGRLPDDPRWPAFCFGLAHGLGLSALLQELRLPGDELLPSIMGFNVGVELGQILAIAAFIGLLALLRAFPFPVRERIPAGFALMSAATVLLAFLVLGVGL